MKRVLEELHVDPRRFSPRAVLSAISNAKSEMIVPERLLSTVRGYGEEVVARAYAAYERALRRRPRRVDFDDLLLVRRAPVRRAARCLQKYAGRYQHVLVDEFQDTNPVQYQLASKLASAHGNITVVGDPDQSIYSWRVRRCAERPVLRTRLPRLHGLPARTELPLDSSDPRSSRRGHRQEPRPPRAQALDRARGRRPDNHLRRLQRRRRGRVRREGDDAARDRWPQSTATSP